MFTYHKYIKINNEYTKINNEYNLEIENKKENEYDCYFVIIFSLMILSVSFFIGYIVYNL